PKTAGLVKRGGKTRHRKGSLTSDQQDLTNLVVGQFGGHSPDVWSDGSVHLVRPGKTARQGSSASIIIGDDGDPILTVFSDHWPGLAPGSYVLANGQLVHPSSNEAMLQGVTLQATTIEVVNYQEAEQPSLLTWEHAPDPFTIPPLEWMIE